MQTNTNTNNPKVTEKFKQISPNTQICKMTLKYFCGGHRMHKYNQATGSGYMYMVDQQIV